MQTQNELVVLDARGDKSAPPLERQSPLLLIDEPVRRLADLLGKPRLLTPFLEQFGIIGLGSLATSRLLGNTSKAERVAAELKVAVASPAVLGTNVLLGSEWVAAWSGVTPEAKLERAKKGGKKGGGKAWRTMWADPVRRPRFVEQSREVSQPGRLPCMLLTHLISERAQVCRD